MTNFEALSQLTHGVYVLTAAMPGKDNGCIIDAVMQATSQPEQIIIGVNKNNLTHGMIVATQAFNLSVLTEATPLKVFQHFGFQSGREVNKFEQCDAVRRSANGIYYIPRYTNAFVSGHVVRSIDMGTHTLFVAEITESGRLSEELSMTYGYYQRQVKPQNTLQNEGKKKRWVCQTCGYVYEGEVLPEGFVCPWCKHDATDFKLVES